MLVTDWRRCGSRPLPEVVGEAVDGGVNVVQLREKDLPAGELLALARQLRGVCGTRALLLINDRLDVALLSGADGVHLGETGLPVPATRQLLPPSMMVGRSVHGVNGARQAEADGADYLVAGAIFASPTHPGAEPAGLSLLREITERVAVPVIAIGGINAENLAECLAAGAVGVAVVSAILGAGDPRRAAEHLVSRHPRVSSQRVPGEHVLTSHRWLASLRSDHGDCVMTSDDETIWVQTAIEEGRLQAQCPQCQALLVREETEGVQVEGCSSCGGLWFDGGELKALAQKRPGLLAGLENRYDPRPDAAPAAPRIGGRLCPACAVFMQEFEFPWAPGVRLDGCPKCQGIWADDGELSRVEAFIARYRREHPGPAAAAVAGPARNAGRVQALHTLMSRPESEG